MRKYLIALALFSVFAQPSWAAASGKLEESAGEKFMNVRINPLGILLGSLSGDVDFKVSSRFTVGPSLSYFSASLLTTSLKGFGIGVRGNYYLTGDAFTDSWIVGPTLGYANFSLSVGNASASASALYVGAIVGHQWVWSNGLNINVGLGAQYYTNKGTLTADNFTLDVPFFHGVVPSGEVTLGYAF